MEGLDRKIKEAKLPGYQSYRKNNAKDNKVSFEVEPTFPDNFTFPFQSLSKLKGPLSTAACNTVQALAAWTAVTRDTQVFFYFLLF